MWKIIFQLMTAAAGCLGFAIVFHMKRSEWPAASLGGILSWAVYLAVSRLTGHDYAAAFIGAGVSALYGEITARLRHAPATVFTVIASVPLIPGAALYRSTSLIVKGSFQDGSTLAVYTLLFAASMSAGIVAASLLVQAFVPKHLNE